MYRTPAKGTDKRVDRTIDVTEEEIIDLNKTRTVRRSIEAIEAKPKSPAVIVGPAESGKKGSVKLRLPANLQAGPSKVTNVRDECKEERKETLDVGLGVAKGRAAEAKACLIKAKLQLNNSRNLKTDIKADVVQALDRLYVLVKEAEEERKKGMNDSKKKEDSGMEKTTESKDREGKEECKEMRKVMSEHVRMIKENNERMKEYKESIEENNRKIEELKEELVKERDERRKGAASYASVAAGTVGVNPPRRPALHSVLVSSEREEETGEQVIKKIREAVDAKDGWVQVERVKKVKDGRVVIGCKNVEERKKLIERISKRGKGLLVEEMRNRDPLLVLRDVLNLHSDEEVVRALESQNAEVFRGLGEGDRRMSVKYRRKARNPLCGHIVLTVSPAVWRRMTDTGRVRVDLQSVRVEDQTPLVQCTRCLGFGHSRRFCRETQDLCSHCGGDHKKAECPLSRRGDEPKCINCNRAKLTNNKHNAFDQECMVRKKWDALARATIAYC